MSRQHVTKSWGAAALAGDRALAKRRLSPPAASVGSTCEQYPDTGRQENRPSPPAGSGFPKEYNVTIGLYQDRMTPSFKCLILEGADLRIGGGKGCGTWDLVRKFKCSFTEADLKLAAVDREVAKK